MSPRFELTREIQIRAIHRLENPALTAEENRDLYGICYGTHGHDYKIRVTVAGPLIEPGGVVVPLDELDQILSEELVERYDGCDLNRLLPNTACEQLAQDFYFQMRPRLGARLVRVGIQETRKNYFEFPAGAAGEATGAGTAGAATDS